LLLLRYLCVTMDGRAKNIPPPPPFAARRSCRRRRKSLFAAYPSSDATHDFPTTPAGSTFTLWVQITAVVSYLCILCAAQRNMTSARGFQPLRSTTRWNCRWLCVSSFLVDVVHRPNSAPGLTLVVSPPTKIKLTKYFDCVLFAHTRRV